jgi:mRNA interferase MazF
MTFYKFSVTVINMTDFRTGDIVFVDIPNGIGCQQSGKRYAVIVSNNVGNRFSPTVQILPATTKRNNSTQPTHAHFNAGECELPHDTVFLAEQILTVNKFQIIRKVSTMNTEQLMRITAAMLYAVPIIAMAFEQNVHEQARFLRIKSE